MQVEGSGGPQAARTSRASHVSGGPGRQSGAPAPDPQPAFDRGRLGLPDLGANAPRMTPRVAPPDQPHSLGVASQIAQAHTAAPLPPGSLTSGPLGIPQRVPTITQKMRAMAPPDIAGQTIEEQKMLANELLTLPEALETSGLAKTHGPSYVAATHAYVDLADETWIDIAEERLEQSGGEQPYRQAAIAIARRVMRMRNESQLAAENTQFPLPRKRPFFWRRRTRMLRDALLDWQSHLSSPANPRKTGRALARMRGATALAEASDFELLLQVLFPAVVGDAVMVLWLGFVVSLIGVLVQGEMETVGTLVLAAVATLAVRVALSLLMRRGPARLDHLFALSVFSALRSPRAGKPGSSIIAVLLRAWGIFITTAGLLGMLAALVYSIWQLVEQSITAPDAALGWIALVGSLIARATLLPTLVGLAAIGVLALPLLLISAVRFAAELSGNIAWVPAARRYALAPAFHVLAFIAAGVVAALAVLAPETGLGNVVLARVSAGSVTQAISLQTLALFILPALVLLIGLDIPYRVGITRWRRNWLRELTTRRTDIDAHVRRLAAADPETGMQNTSEENLRAMQYDMVLLQFYTTHTEETRRVPSAPYNWIAGIGVVLVLVVVALLVDGLAQQIAHLLFNVG
ncbi:MAG TPA: hypothetical protein VF040_14150 [Ktedonobacterales bacterium]